MGQTSTNGFTASKRKISQRFHRDFRPHKRGFSFTEASDALSITSRQHPLHESVRVQRPFDATNTSDRHAVLSRDIRVRAGSVSDCQCFRRRDTQRFLCERKPTLLGTINHVFLIGADEQMGWSNAHGIVAMMTDKKTRGDGTEAERVSVTMRIRLSSINTDPTILIPFCARPCPTHPPPVTHDFVVRPKVKLVHRSLYRGPSRRDA